MICFQGNTVLYTCLSPSAAHFECLFVEGKVLFDLFVIFGVVHHSCGRYDEISFMPLPGKSAAGLIKPSSWLLDHLKTTQFVHISVFRLKEVVDGLPPKHVVCHRQWFISGLEHVVEIDVGFEADVVFFDKFQYLIVVFVYPL